MRHLTLLAIVSALGASAQVGGGQGKAPSILSGGGPTSASGESGFQPWLSVNGTYTRSLDKGGIGAINQGVTPGVAGGISAWKAWNRKKLEASYSGSAGTSINANSDGDWRPNHTVVLGYSQQVNQRLSFGAVQVGGFTYGGYGYGAAFGITGVPGLSSSFSPGSPAGGSLNGEFGNLANNGVVSGEFLNNLTKFSLSSGSVSYLLNQRWMVSGMGGAYFVRRPQQQYSQDSLQASASVSHLLSQFSMIGGEYSQLNSRYTNLFGGVSSQSAMLNYQTQFSSTMTFSAGAGVGLMRSEFVGPVPIDPAIAELLGTSTVLQATQTRFLTPYYNASLSKRFERGSVSVGGGRGTSAGNGVVMAGVQDAFGGNYSRTLNSRIGASWFAAYNRLSGRVATLAVSQVVQTGGMMSILMFRSTSLTCQAGFRYRSVSTSPRQRELFAGFGLAWSPGGKPFTF